MSRESGSSLPTITSQIPRDVRNYLDRVRDVLNRIEKQDYVNESSLKRIGLLNADGSPAATDSENQYGIPPVVTNFTATGAYRIVILDWDMPNYPGHAYTEIWGSDIWDNGVVTDPSSYDNLENATLLYTAGGAVTADSIGGNSGRYYWARNVNLDNTAGAFNSVGGTRADTAVDVEYLLEVLTEAISESELTEDLSSRIDLIDGPASLLGSVAQRIADEAAARATAISDEAAARAAAISDEATARATAISGEATARAAADADEALARANAIAAEAQARADALNAASQSLQSQINDLLAVVAYDNTASYVIGDQVTYDDKLYRAIANTTGNLPTDTNYWQLLGDYTSLGDFVGQNAAAITQINTIDATSTSAAAQAIQALKTTVDNPTTGVTATANALDLIETAVNDTETGLSATVTRVGTLETTVNNPTTGVAATANALDLIETAVNDTDTGLSATANRVGTLESIVNNEETGLAATANVLDTLKTAVEDTETGLSATVARVSVIQAAVEDETTGLSANAGAIDLVTAEVFPDGTTEASSIFQLSTTVGDNAAAVEAAAESIDGLNAKYTVKIDNNGAVAGYGLASAPNDAGEIVSEFIVNADRFAILKGATDTGDPVVPFSVITTATTINGVLVPAGVYISDAFVANGTITNAKIGEAAIDDAKISSLNAEKITTGILNAERIGVGSIDANRITSNTITAEQIGANIITGDEIAAGAISANELAISASNDGTANSIYMDASGAIKIYDASGNVRVKLGNLSV